MDAYPRRYTFLTASLLSILGQTPNSGNDLCSVCAAAAVAIDGVRFKEGGASGTICFSCQAVDQSSQDRALIRPNSLVLAVTRVTLCRSAWPAIRRSYCPSGLPIFSISARTSPAKRASWSSNARRFTQFERNSASFFEFASRRELFATPYQSSKADTEETDNSEFSLSSFTTRASICGDFSLSTAMQTFVSRRY